MAHKLKVKLNEYAKLYIPANEQSIIKLQILDFDYDHESVVIKMI